MNMAGLRALIPLDGTKLSESAMSVLPFIKLLGFDAVRLVSVWESAWEETESGRDDAELSEVAEKGRTYLDAYLNQQAENVRQHGFEPEIVVRVGRPAEEILEAAGGVDLILIATHGRSGLARWWLGSVADQVIRESKCPVLVIGPNVKVDIEHYNVKRILLPLDGSETAEQALPLASWISRVTGAELEVVRAMSLTAVAYDPGVSMYSGELVTAMEDSVKAYLEKLGRSLEGLNARTTMLIGTPGEQLLQYEEENDVDLVVATTHGRSGLKRAALGSVTDRLLHGSSPVLVLRPDEEESSALMAAAGAGASPS
jgi:nucleotide-binding universal stress UspA family protein